MVGLLDWLCTASHDWPVGLALHSQMDDWPVGLGLHSQIDDWPVGLGLHSQIDGWTGFAQPVMIGLLDSTGFAQPDRWLDWVCTAR